MTAVETNLTYDESTFVCVRDCPATLLSKLLSDEEQHDVTVF
jgi:hypothetical protein